MHFIIAPISILSDIVFRVTVLRPWVHRLPQDRSTNGGFVCHCYTLVYVLSFKNRKPKKNWAFVSSSNNGKMQQEISKQVERPPGVQQQHQTSTSHRCVCVWDTPTNIPVVC